MDIKDTHFIKISEEEERQFNKLIKIIIDDYKNYPNFSHFFNIKNIFEFFNIEEKLINEKENKKLENELNENEEPIVFKYFSNISGKTKLFSNKFVLNNKEKFKIEIED